MGGCTSSHSVVSPVVVVAPAGSKSPAVPDLMSEAAVRARKRGEAAYVAPTTSDEERERASSDAFAASPFVVREKDSLTKALMCVMRVVGNSLCVVGSGASG